MKPFALFLFDYTTTIAAPWRAAGFETLSVDIRHPLRSRDGDVLNVDLTTIGPLAVALHERGLSFGDAAFMGCFPVCTDVAVSGARDFHTKGLRALSRAVAYFATCQEAASLVGPDCVWFVENPVSAMASHWRKPDHYFDPADYTGFCAEDNYTKKTSLWASGNFIMPPPKRLQGLPPPDNRILAASLSERRADFRAAFPAGFSRAVFEANYRHLARALTDFAGAS